MDCVNNPKTDKPCKDCRYHKFHKGTSPYFEDPGESDWYECTHEAFWAHDLISGILSKSSLCASNRKQYPECPHFQKREPKTGKQTKIWQDCLSFATHAVLILGALYGADKKQAELFIVACAGLIASLMTSDRQAEQGGQR